MISRAGLCCPQCTNADHPMGAMLLWTTAHRRGYTRLEHAMTPSHTDTNLCMLENKVLYFSSHDAHRKEGCGHISDNVYLIKSHTVHFPETQKCDFSVWITG